MTQSKYKSVKFHSLSRCNVINKSDVEVIEQPWAISIINKVKDGQSTLLYFCLNTLNTTYTYCIISTTTKYHFISTNQQHKQYLFLCFVINFPALYLSGCLFCLFNHWEMLFLFSMLMLRGDNIYKFGLSRILLNMWVQLLRIFWEYE